MLTPAYITVYSARALTWCMLLRILLQNISYADIIHPCLARVDLEELTPLGFPLDDLRRLILPEKEKKLLMKAIEAAQTQHQQVAPAASAMDPRSHIADRLFILLHGPQGTGKSLAAQCLANYARRPLFIFTSSMMSTAEARLVDHLGDIFKLAKRWGCLVHIDHVDTIILKRNKTTMENNAAVPGRL